MLVKKYKNTVYFIALTIVATIIAQVYWNVKNYEVNKQQISNQIQTSFDDSVDKYYAEIAKNDVYKIVANDSLYSPNSRYSLKMSKSLNAILDSIDKSNTQISKPSDSISLEFSNHNYTTDVWVQGLGDSISKKSKRNLIMPTFGHSKPVILKKFSTSKKGINLGSALDSLEIQDFTSKIILSFQNSILVLKKLDSLFISELKRKNITLHHGLKYEVKEMFSEVTTTVTHNLKDFSKEYTSTTSNSKFLPKDSKLTVLYINTTSEIFKRTLGSILLSLLLSLLIIGCLLFLLNTIFKQKQLAEVKNDLISNITHEFKTPIATIGVALESIQNFNAIKDAEKTKSYLNISNNQLKKLNIMVEKLLETASLDSNNLSLNKEETNIASLLQTIIEKHQMQLSEKAITFNKPTTAVFATVDVFHFENALNNVIDNAVKYGGNKINIELNQDENSFKVAISDNGNSLTKIHKEQIFEKFYRVPKGNTHTIKGFGIGLYYAKKIIEKHNGTIDLELKSNATTFKISLPNE